jgi:hypothetical protein
MDITDKIKTFDDACKAIGLAGPEALPELLQEKYAAIVPSHIKAQLKLEIITLALNEGWQHIPDGKHWAYWPWFCLYTAGEIADMGKKGAEERAMINATDISDVFAGLGYAFSVNAWSRSYAHVGSRLAYKSRELARYSGKQFIELWKEAYLIPINR